MKVLYKSTYGSNGLLFPRLIRNCRNATATIQNRYNYSGSDSFFFDHSSLYLQDMHENLTCHLILTNAVNDSPRSKQSF